MSRPRDKDGGWAWVVLCACAVCVMVTSGLAMLAGMFQEVFLEEFEGGVVMTSWITSLYASLMQLVGPVTGVVCSVFGCRSSVMAGGTLLAAGFLGSSFCSSLITLLLAFGIAIGTGLGLVYSAAIVAVNLSFERYRPVATGSVLAAGGLGIMLMPLLLRFLLDAYGWRHTLSALCALSAQLVVAGALLFPSGAGVRRRRSRRSGDRRQFLCRFERRQQTPTSHPAVEKLSEKLPPDLQSGRVDDSDKECVPQECAPQNSPQERAPQAPQERAPQGRAPQNSPQRAHTDVGEGSQSVGHRRDAEGTRDPSNPPDSGSGRHGRHDVFSAGLSTCRPDHVDAAVTGRLPSDGTRSARGGGVGNLQDLQPPKFSSQGTGGSSEHAPAGRTSEHGPSSRLGEHAPTSSSSEHGPTSSSSEHRPTSSSSEPGPTSSSSEHGPTSSSSEPGPTSSSSEHRPTSSSSEYGQTSSSSEHGPTSSSSEHGQTNRSSNHALTSKSSEHAPTSSSSEHGPTRRTSEHASTSRTSEHEPTAATTSEDEETAPFLSSDSAREQTLAAAASISTSLTREEELTFLTNSPNNDSLQRPKPCSSHHPDLSSDRREGTWGRYLAVMTNSSLVTICLQLCLGNAAVGIVLVHFPAFSLQTGLDKDAVSSSFSANGVGLTVGRFLLGVLVQDRHVDPLSLYVGLAFVTSVLMVVTPVVAVTATWQITMMLAIGFYAGSSYSLLTEITIHCTGVDALGFAFGMEMISAGLGFLVAPPIAGWLVELTSSYGNAIFLAGVLYFVASCVAMAISVMRPIWKPGGHLGHFERVVTSQAASSAEDMT